MSGSLRALNRSKIQGDRVWKFRVNSGGSHGEGPRVSEPNGHVWPRCGTPVRRTALRPATAACAPPRPASTHARPTADAEDFNPLRIRPVCRAPEHVLAGARRGAHRGRGPATAATGPSGTDVPLVDERSPGSWRPNPDPRPTLPGPRPSCPRGGAPLFSWRWQALPSWWREGSSARSSRTRAPRGTVPGPGLCGRACRGPRIPDHPRHPHGRFGVYGTATRASPESETDEP